MPRPLSGQPGSGLHIAITLKGADRAATDAFAEGVLRRYREISCLANPTLNSYKRLKKAFGIGYASLRGAAPMRIFGDNIIQLRTSDSTCNIFSVLALVFAAGREGIENGCKLRKEGETDGVMFDSIEDAIDFARKSKWLHARIPARLDEVLDTIERRCKAAKELKTDAEFFDFYADI